MRYLGIDFGTKRIGLAISDESGRMAFPLEVVPFDKKLLEKVLEIIKREKVDEVVIGESKNFKMENNPIASSASDFAKSLAEDGVIVHFEPEFLTSYQAEKIQGKNKMSDASAASIILQSWLDKKKPIANSQ